jgi:hypothetical protein
MVSRDAHLKAATLVRDTGGTLVGRTRLQKVAYLAQLAGFGGGFDFEYRHYGPYSEELATSMEIASGLGFVREEERRAEWGGRYSIYYRTDRTPQSTDAARIRFATAAAEIAPVELELAATAAFLFAFEGIGRDRPGDPWQETARRKPEKAGDGRIERAKRAYRALKALPTRTPLPAI